MLVVAIIMIYPDLAFAEHIAIIHSLTEESSNLYLDMKGDAIGYYYNNLPLEVLAQYGDFSFVRIRDENLSIEGYMRSKDLRSDIDICREALRIHVGTILPESKAVLREQPALDALEIGRLQGETKIQIIGKYKNFFHAYNGDRYCFVLCEAVRLIEDSVISNAYGDLPEIGYLFPKRMNAPILKLYPSHDAPVEEGLEMLYSYPSRPLEVIADLGQWFQVRIMDNNSYYYLPKAEVQQIVLLSDWLLNADSIIPVGRYRVGENMKAGLYTYILAEGQTGSLRIDTADTLYEKKLDTVGPAFYTLYIPQNADVIIQSGGELHPAIDFNTNNKTLSYSGNGMFFVGLQFPKFSLSRCGMTYCFTVSEYDEGRVAIYNIDGSLLEEHVIRNNECFEATPTLLDNSKFVEIENCEVEFLFSSNG